MRKKAREVLLFAFANLGQSPQMGEASTEAILHLYEIEKVRGWVERTCGDCQFTPGECAFLPSDGPVRRLHTIQIAFQGLDKCDAKRSDKSLVE
tara:strand:+ start:755 stop:1036 length:282 start_codon:yes stop_codon:yes gene_type:complete